MCRVVRTPEAAVELARELNVDEAWIIGGRQVYKALDQNKDLSVVYKTILVDSYDCDIVYFFDSRDFKEEGAPAEIDRGHIHKLVRV